MAKSKKITKDELASIQEAVGKINNLYMNVGRAIVGAIAESTNIEALNNALKDQQESLEGKYGAVTVNLQTGEYEEIVEEAVEA